MINQELCAERYAYLKTQPGFGAWPDITDGMLCAGILDVGGKVIQLLFFTVIIKLDYTQKKNKYMIILRVFYLHANN